RHGRDGERPRSIERRAERLHPGGQSLHLQHPQRPAAVIDAYKRLMNVEPPPPSKKVRGFFTDTSLCIGCKACEVACKEWNQLPADGFAMTGNSYDNTGTLGATTWRHVQFIEQAKANSSRQDQRWLMMS